MSDTNKAENLMRFKKGVAERLTRVIKLFHLTEEEQQPLLGATLLLRANLSDSVFKKDNTKVQELLGAGLDAKAPCVEFVLARMMASPKLGGKGIGANILSRMLSEMTGLDRREHGYINHLNEKRTRDGFPPLEPTQAATIVSGLFVALNGESITERDYDALDKMVDYSAAEFINDKTIRSVKQERAVSVNNQTQVPILKANEGEVLRFNLGNTECRAVQCGKLMTYDFEVMVTAYRVAKKFPQVRGPFRYLVPPLRAIAKAYTGHTDEEACKFVLASLNRLRTAGFQDLQPIGVDEETIAELPPIRQGLTSLWPAEPVWVFVPEKKGLRTKGKEAGGIVREGAERLTEIPILYEVDAKINRLVVLKPSVRPSGLYYTDRNESVFTILSRRLVAIARSRISRRVECAAVFDELQRYNLIKDGATREEKNAANMARDRVLKTIEKTIQHWVNAGIADIRVERSNGTLTAFELFPPYEENTDGAEWLQPTKARPLAPTPADGQTLTVKERYNVMRERLYDPISDPLEEPFEREKRAGRKRLVKGK